MGVCPIILSTPMLMLLPPFGTLDILWAREEIVFLQSPQILMQYLLGIAWSRKCYLEVFRYLISITRFHQAGLPLISLQIIFPPKARFISFGERIPKPPCSWSCMTFFQLMRLYFLFSHFPPCQRNCRIMASTLWWKVAGAWRRENWYRGREERTDLRRIRWPARLSQEAPQCYTFLFIFSMMMSHTSAFRGLVLTSMPR